MHCHLVVALHITDIDDGGKLGGVAGLVIFHTCPPGRLSGVNSRIWLKATSDQGHTLFSDTARSRRTSIAVGCGGLDIGAGITTFAQISAWQ